MNFAETRLNNEIKRNKDLQQILANIEHQLLLENNTKNKLPDTNLLQKEKSFQKQSISLKGKIEKDQPGYQTKNPLKPQTKSSSDTDNLVLSSKEMKIVIYEYKFAKPIIINKSVNIVEISSLVLVKYDISKKPKDIKVQIVMKESDADLNNGINDIAFYKVTSEINTDNTIKCAFQENPKPKLDQYGLPSYQRNLSIVLTGSLNNSVLDCLLTWDEISGRPMYARFKIPVISVK